MRWETTSDLSRRSWPRLRAPSARPCRRRAGDDGWRSPCHRAVRISAERSRDRGRACRRFRDSPCWSGSAEPACARAAGICPRPGRESAACRSPWPEPGARRRSGRVRRVRSCGKLFMQSLSMTTSSPSDGRVRDSRIMLSPSAFARATKLQARCTTGGSIIFDPRLTTARPFSALPRRRRRSSAPFRSRLASAQTLRESPESARDGCIPCLQSPERARLLPQRRRPSMSPTSPKTESMACTPAAGRRSPRVARVERFACLRESSPRPGRRCNLRARWSVRQRSRWRPRWQRRSRFPARIQESASARSGG